MAMTYTLGSTGRQIANALNAGKSIMVHTSLGGFDSYNTPSEITFSTSQDSFFMSVAIAGEYVEFNGTLDGELVVGSDGGDSGGIK